MGHLSEKDFLTIDYLAQGSVRQRRCFNILKQHRIFEILDLYTPLLTGTIPIGIDVESSDLDIICRVDDFEEFKRYVTLNFHNYRAFHISLKDEVMVINFYVEEMEIEIFATNQPYYNNNAYRHLLTEYRVLNLLGEKFREEILQLRHEGVKTEPAFARLLGLEGDPFEALLNLESVSDTEIIEYYR